MRRMSSRAVTKGVGFVNTGLATISGRLFPETRQLTEADDDGEVEEFQLTSEIPALPPPERQFHFCFLLLYSPKSCNLNSPGRHDDCVEPTPADAPLLQRPLLPLLEHPRACAHDLQGLAPLSPGSVPHIRHPCAIFLPMPTTASPLSPLSPISPFHSFPSPLHHKPPPPPPPPPSSSPPPPPLYIWSATLAQ